MLPINLKIAFRSLKQHPGITAINVLGLTVGLAACLLIGLWVQHQLRHDAFHPNADRIVRLEVDLKLGDTEVQGPLSPAPMGRTLVREFPDAVAATRLFDPGSVPVRQGNRSFMETDALAADSTFFEVLSGFRLIRGAPETVLDAADAVVLTPSAAQRYFGTADPVGQTLTIDGQTRRVTGIAAEPPSASHLRFDLVLAQHLPERLATQWAANNFYTYVMLEDAAARADLQAHVNRFVSDTVIPQMEKGLGIPLDQMLSEGGTFAYSLRPLRAIHLHADSDYELQPTGDVTYVYVFSLIALFILGIACINFMNLATARASERATEVGMRKSLGADRRQLVGQFLAEAGLVTALSVGGAVLLARLALPVFNAVAETALSAALLWSGPVLGGLAVLVLLVTLGAGSYPALVLSRFQPAEVLRSGGRTHTGSQGARLRKGLVVVQFAISVALIAGTLVVRAQFDYIQSKRLGLDTERVVAIERADDLGRQQQAFLNQVQRLPGVTATGAADALYAGGVSSGVFRPEGRPRSDAQSFNYLWTGFGVTDALSLTLVQGRSFSPERASDSTAVLINEAAAQRLGWETPVGKTLTTPLSSAADRPYTIIGVVENFHFASLRRAIQPLVLLPHATLDRAYIRLQAGPSTDALRDVEDVWTRFAAGVPFQYAFVDQQYDALHRSTQRTGQLFLGFAGLAILIAGLGLFGLATYTAQRRTQEIGIRKALGASVLSIVRLLSADVLRRVAVGVGLGLPLAYLGLQRWLADFAYRMDMGIGLFLGAAALALGIALLTVGAQAARAARIDPAQTLRSE